MKTVTIKTDTKELADMIVRKRMPKGFRNGTYDIEFSAKSNGIITIVYKYNKEATKLNKVVDAL